MEVGYDASMDSIVTARINAEQVKTYRRFLLEYQWRGRFPEEVEGLLELLEQILDLSVNAPKRDRWWPSFTTHISVKNEPSVWA